MDITRMIDAAVRTHEEKDQERMRAALELGVRFAINAMVTSYGYANNDVKTMLMQLNGQAMADTPYTPTAPVEALEPSF